ncbi:MAG TPA: nucleotidyltransferase family protein [Pyrinomonadaceae bacterium]|jgi:hypothetical protein
MGSKLVDPSLKESENDRRWLILRARLFEENIKKAVGLFQSRGIDPILIKGWAAALEYPEKHQRVFGDIDLSVAPEVYEKSRSLIRDASIGHLNIDLHCGLRHLDTASWERLFKNSRIVHIDEVPVRILCVEDHLRVLCVHWLTDGGAYRERLLDIYHLLDKNAETFDWDRCLAPVDENRRDWIIKTIGVVNRFHRLNTSKMPFAKELHDLPEWFIKALEKEWSSETRLQPIHIFFKNKKEFWKQLKKRLPPNPIQATVEMEGRFDDSSRVFYQIGSILQRTKPSLRRTLVLIKNRYRSKNK